MSKLMSTYKDKLSNACHLVLLSVFFFNTNPSILPFINPDLSNIRNQVIGLLKQSHLPDKMIHLPLSRFTPKQSHLANL